MRRFFLVLLLALAACGGSERNPSVQNENPLPDRVTGLITQIDYAGDDVIGFWVDTRTGERDVRIDPEIDYGFNLKHLEKHQEQGLAVDVPVDIRGEELYAVEILDA